MITAREAYGYYSETCIQAKATAKISYTPMPRAEEVLEKVHSDICGPISPGTFGKKRYFVSFIDDYSRYADIRLLGTRDDLYTEFKDWLNTEEQQIGAKLKRLHSDNAKEYKSDEFKAILPNGAIGTYAAPYSPQQNGISERFNRTLMNKVRSMLIESGLPKALWGEAALAATYIYNRTPHASLPGLITPYEAKTGQKPDISNVRVWGSIAYKKESEKLIKKLDLRANLYILIGYSSNQYKIIRPGSKRVLWARDVDIIEGRYMRDIHSQQIERMAILGTQLQDINQEPLITPNDEPSTEKWLESFHDDLQRYSEDIDEYALIMTDPTYYEAIKSDDAPKWREAMLKENESLLKQNTWTLVPKSDDIKVLKGKWVLKIKELPNGEPIYKARWVAKGFQQRLGVDFNETFANTVNPIAYRLILAIGAYLDWEIQQWDVKSAYPNASLKEKVYIQQPISLEDPEKPDYICLLNKALYGLKQSGREWQEFLRDLLSKREIYPLKTD